MGAGRNLERLAPKVARPTTIPEEALVAHTARHSLALELFHIDRHRFPSVTSLHSRCLRCIRSRTSLSTPLKVGIRRTFERAWFRVVVLVVSQLSQFSRIALRPCRWTNTSVLDHRCARCSTLSFPSNHRRWPPFAISRGARN